MKGTVMAEQSTITIQYQTVEQVYNRAKQLVGMKFSDVLDLEIYPDGVVREYNSRNYKGGMGNLLEERFFGYRANSDREPDFAEAGVELKATCIDTRKNGKEVAGERLVLTMIPYDEEAPESIYDSHLWHKCQKLLLVWYKRDRSCDKYDQEIAYVHIFEPPEDDLRVIESDYDIITGLIREGRANELSESLTTYLGACTKGATAAKSMRDQALYAPGKMARARAFSFKRPYMDYVLHHYVMGEPEAERVIKDPKVLKRQSLLQYVTRIINGHVGKSDRELCEQLDIEYTGNKAQWTTIAYRLLGIRGNQAAEFEKAGIRVRTLRVEASGERIQENFPLQNIDFKKLAAETSWEDSELRELLVDMRYLFVVFQKADDCLVLRGCKAWSMPEADLDGPVHDCWSGLIDVLNSGVSLTRKTQRTGKVVVQNNLPKVKDNPIAHVRPRADLAAYRFSDGTEIGDVLHDAEELPDGQWMTRQCFWLKQTYVFSQISDLIRS